MPRDTTVPLLTTWRDLLAATSGDAWVRLHADAAADDGPGQAWRGTHEAGSAVAWTSPDPTDLGELRTVLHGLGDGPAVAALIADVLAATPEGRVVTLPAAGAARLAQHGFEMQVEARWNYRALSSAPAPVPGGTVGWLPPGEATRRQVLWLLERHAPELTERAGHERVVRWAGVRDGADGPLVAVCADASPRSVAQGATTGLLASVAVHREQRRQGLGSLLIRWTASAMFAEGRASVGLAVYTDNTGALAAYDRLGFDDRPFVTARIRRGNRS